MPGPRLQLAQQVRCHWLTCAHLQSSVYSTGFMEPCFRPPEVWGTHCSWALMQQGEGRWRAQVWGGAMRPSRVRGRAVEAAGCEGLREAAG